VTLNDGRTICSFNVIDNFNREGLGADVDLSLPRAVVIRKPSSGAANHQQYAMIMALKTLSRDIEAVQ